MLAFNWIGWLEVAAVWAAAFATLWAIRVALAQSEAGAQEARRIERVRIVADQAERLIEDHPRLHTGIIASVKGQGATSRVPLEYCMLVCSRIDPLLAAPAEQILHLFKEFDKRNPTNPNPITSAHSHAAAARGLEAAIVEYSAWLRAWDGSDDVPGFASAVMDSLNRMADLRHADFTKVAPKHVQVQLARWQADVEDVALLLLSQCEG